jgi:hypothetical protein
VARPRERCIAHSRHLAVNLKTSLIASFKYFEGAEKFTAIWKMIN